MKILSVGHFSRPSNTSVHRMWALWSVATHVDAICLDSPKISWTYRLRNKLFQWGLKVYLPDEPLANARIIDYVRSVGYDFVWIDKGLTVYPNTLRKIKFFLPNCKIVSYSPDNMALRYNQSQQYIESVPLYDCIVTNKSYIINDLKTIGARKVIFVNNSFEPTYHHPFKLSQDEIMKFGGDVGFIGAWEASRCEFILSLVSRGIKVRVWGGGKWLKYKGRYENLRIEDSGLFSIDYCRAISAFKINLCFLRKMNFDRQTTRSVEIPACGGFMLAERTDEHIEMFKEGVEADFFSSEDELFSKCVYYLHNDEARRKIAYAGLLRSKEYSNESMVRDVISKI